LFLVLLVNGCAAAAPAEPAKAPVPHEVAFAASAPAETPPARVQENEPPPYAPPQMLTHSVTIGADPYYGAAPTSQTIGGGSSEAPRAFGSTLSPTSHPVRVYSHPVRSCPVRVGPGVGHTSGTTPGPNGNWPAPPSYGPRMLGTTGH
jgi:hypothetical protein